MSPVAHMLLDHTGGKTEGACFHRIAEQLRDGGRFRCSRGSAHGVLAHHVVAQRRQWREERQIHGAAALARGIHVLRKRFPIPRDAGLQHVVRNAFHIDQILQANLARLWPARRDSNPAVAHHDRGDAMPR